MSFQKDLNIGKCEFWLKYTINFHIGQWHIVQLCHEILENQVLKIWTDHAVIDPYFEHWSMIFLKRNSLTIITLQKLWKPFSNCFGPGVTTWYLSQFTLKSIKYEHPWDL